jgi:hypothetical protein
MTIRRNRPGRTSLGMLTSLSLALAWTATSPLARADVSPPPDPNGCRGSGAPSDKTQGSACAVSGTAGTCEYAETRYVPTPGIVPDDSSTPQRTLRCVDKNGNVLDLANGEEVVTPSGGSDAGTPGGGGSGSKSSCTMTPTARAIGPWCLALIVPALAFGLRRRRDEQQK